MQIEGLDDLFDDIGATLERYVDKELFSDNRILYDMCIVALSRCNVSEYDPSELEDITADADFTLCWWAVQMYPNIREVSKQLEGVHLRIFSTVQRFSHSEDLFDRLQGVLEDFQSRLVRKGVRSPRR